MRVHNAVILAVADEHRAFDFARPAFERILGDEICDAIGEKVKSGKVVQIMGDLASVNGRDRSEAFRDCMKSKYPGITVLEIPAEWKADKASSGLDNMLTANPDIKGVYMMSLGVKPGKTLTVCTADVVAVTDGREKTIATMTGTLMAIYDRPDVPAGF